MWSEGPERIQPQTWSLQINVLLMKSEQLYFNRCNNWHPQAWREEPRGIQLRSGKHLGVSRWRKGSPGKHSTVLVLRFSELQCDPSLGLPRGRGGDYSVLASYTTELVASLRLCCEALVQLLRVALLCTLLSPLKIVKFEVLWLAVPGKGRVEALE